MSMLASILGELAASHVLEVLSENRDCRLIFPGLTRSLALELHEQLRQQLAVTGRRLPVYLALDHPGPLDPDETKGWLQYEAVTSVRQGSFIVVCMPKVLPRLHDSIRGSGGPIRAVVFSDEWPWRDDGAEPFRFDGPVLEAILERWSLGGEDARWCREILLRGLIPATAPLRDSVRVPLLLEEIIGAFGPDLYPELVDLLDKFFFHCGIPRLVSRENQEPSNHISTVTRTARALDEQRQKNPEFRDHLVRDVLPSTFAALDHSELSVLQNALELALDGVFSLGVDSGVLAFRGGLGLESTSESTTNWRSLDIDRLQKILGVGAKDRVSCAASLQAGSGVVSQDGRHVVLFEGSYLQLDIEAEISPERFVPGDFAIRCKRRQRVVDQSECAEPRVRTRFVVAPNELPSTGSRISLAVQLVRFQQVVRETRVFVHVCGGARPALAVFEPGFEVVDLLEPPLDEASPDSVELSCDEPVRVQLLDSSSGGECRVLAEEELLTVATQPGQGGTLYSVREVVDAENFPGARVDLRLEASGRERDVTLSAEDIEPGEFTLEDELRVATASSSSLRLRRVLPFFRGEGDLVLPRLGDVDSSSRGRMMLAQQIEGDSRWRPILVDFLSGGVQDGEFVTTGMLTTQGVAQAPSFLRDVDLSNEVKAVIAGYDSRRQRLIDAAGKFVRGYSTPSERPLYVVSPTYVSGERETSLEALCAYLDSYGEVLDLLAEPGMAPAEIFTLVHLDSVVLECCEAANALLNLRVSLLGPWHPLVVAKRFMVQLWLYAAAENEDRLAKQHRRLASLFERIDGFRVVAGFDGDGLGLDLTFAFPTSDPGWHVAVASGALQALPGTSIKTLRGLGERLESSLGLRSALYLAGTELWSQSFLKSFQRSHPSRQQLGLRVKRGLHARPVVDSCCRLLDEPSGGHGALPGLLPGGIHLFLEDRLEERKPLSWQRPMVFIYEQLSDDECYSNFQPDILLLPQREESRPAWLPRQKDRAIPVPRGRGLGSAFFSPLVDLASDRNGLPVARLIEIGAREWAAPPRSAGEAEGSKLGERFCGLLRRVELLGERIRSQRPALVQELGLPETLHCDWTVLPGAHVDAGALGTYIAGGGSASSENRALWDFRLDIGESVSSYFIVCRIPRSVLAALASNPLCPGPTGASAVLKELAEVGFAVGETMRSGKAAVGVLGVVGALRLARSAWATGNARGRRWCTILLPVDCFTDVLVAAPGDGSSGKRTDLLALNLSWTASGAEVSISACAIECKYVSREFPPSAVGSALEQAEATHKVVQQLLSFAQSDSGMHARLAVCQIVRFGLRLLAARGEIGIADEQLVLEAILSGSFTQSPALAPTLLVTTSTGATGKATVRVRDDGWWVSLSGESWPPSVSDVPQEVATQLSQVFAATKREIPGERDTSTAGGRGHQPGGSTIRTDGGRLLSATTTAAAPHSPDQEAEPPVAAVGEVHEGEPAASPGPGTETISHPAFQRFVGNAAAVEALSIQLRYAEETGAPTMRAVGLFGPKSTGKTELARRLAVAMHAPFLPFSETSLRDVDQLAQRMQELARESGNEMRVVGREGGHAVLRCPPMLIFIDEVHQLSSRVQDSLLPVLEADDRTLRGSSITIDVGTVTFVIATTDWGKLREPFRSRVRAIELKPYTVQEVAEILRFRIQAIAESHVDGLQIDPAVERLEDEALRAIATAAKAVPRVALDLLREVGMALRIRLCEPTAEAVWQHLQRLVPCDRHGLTAQDREYLRVVFQRGPLGVDNIATQLGTDKANVTGGIEPFLVQMGWVQRAPSGRTLTGAGRRFVAGLDSESQ